MNFTVSTLSIRPLRHSINVVMAVTDCWRSLCTPDQQFYPVVSICQCRIWCGSFMTRTILLDITVVPDYDREVVSCLGEKLGPSSKACQKNMAMMAK